MIFKATKEGVCILVYHLKMHVRCFGTRLFMHSNSVFAYDLLLLMGSCKNKTLRLLKKQSQTLLFEDT